MAALMIEAGAQSLEGVTIAYDEFAGSRQDEAPVAARIAAYFGIRHHVRRVARAEFHADLPRILDAMDHPSVDGINTWYASKAVAERGLKVVVSGVVGEEQFKGYGRRAIRCPGCGVRRRSPSGRQPVLRGEAATVVCGMRPNGPSRSPVPGGCVAACIVRANSPA
jgi:asparagine synthase (glutamine-hydrolysing)